jgi:hypothetical protein
MSYITARYLFAGRRRFGLFGAGNFKADKTLLFVRELAICPPLSFVY